LEPAGMGCGLHLEPAGMGCGLYFTLNVYPEPFTPAGVKAKGFE